MNPMHECKGLLLASAATRKGDPSALASSTAISGAKTPGHHDKVPVCTQNLPEAERCVSSLDAVLPWPWEALTSTHQEPDIASGGRVATVSLRRGLPCQWVYHFTTECLLTSTHRIAHLDTTVKSSKARRFLKRRERRASAPVYSENKIQ